MIVKMTMQDSKIKLAPPSSRITWQGEGQRGGEKELVNPPAQPSST
jgi:hypothetical protein